MEKKVPDINSPEHLEELRRWITDRGPAYFASLERQEERAKERLAHRTRSEEEIRAERDAAVAKRLRLDELNRFERQEIQMTTLEIKAKYDRLRAELDA